MYEIYENMLDATTGIINNDQYNSEKPDNILSRIEQYILLFYWDLYSYTILHRNFWPKYLIHIFTINIPRESTSLLDLKLQALQS